MLIAVSAAQHPRQSEFTERVLREKLELRSQWRDSDRKSESRKERIKRWKNLRSISERSPRKIRNAFTVLVCICRMLGVVELILQSSGLYFIWILSRNFMCCGTETILDAAIIPDAATAGMPMPGKVESPQQKKFGQLVPVPGSIPSVARRKGP